MRDVQRWSENVGRGGGDGGTRGRAFWWTARSGRNMAAGITWRPRPARTMSQGAPEREPARERRTLADAHAAADERVPINFADFPFHVTSKYVIQHRLDEAYPPRTLLQDPRTEGAAGARADADPVVDVADPSGESLAHAVRTRSATQEHKDAADELQLFDKDEAHDRLAQLATEHFAAMPPPKESDAIVGFLYRCRAGDSVLQIV